MKRVVVTGLAAAFVFVLGAGCDDGEPHHHHRFYAECTVQPTCGTCTPVLGCGWCSTGTAGQSGGVCVDDPSACPVGSTSFTWDPPGCTSTTDGGLGDARVPADARVKSDDAAASEAPDASTFDAANGNGDNDAASDASRD